MVYLISLNNEHVEFKGNIERAITYLYLFKLMVQSGFLKLRVIHIVLYFIVVSKKCMHLQRCFLHFSPFPENDVDNESSFVPPNDKNLSF